MVKSHFTNNTPYNCLFLERKAVFINVGRGNVVDETELVEALEKQWLRGAILDVFQKEPLPKESKLWNMRQVRITPHISGPTVAKEFVEVFKSNYELYSESKPLLLTVDWSKEY